MVEVPVRVEELDALLGDPWDTGNPVGHAAALHADERHEMLTEAERRLDRFGLNAEFVPAHYGGRLERADRLADAQRAIWRRDPCLGAGHTFGSFAAWAVIWASGTQDQRRRAAELLVANGRIAAAFHGSDRTDATCTARRDAGRWQLNGRAELVANLAPADALVLSARIDGSAGHRRQFLVPRADLRGTAARDLPRRGSSGMRGLTLTGIEFRDCPVPADALLGDADQDLAAALPGSHLIAAIVASCTIGPLDTALRSALGFASGRRLYGATAADIPYVRAVIARAYADLLAADALSAVTLRAVHLSPAAAVYAPAARYLTSRLVLDAFEDLRSVLGAQGYLRQGRYAIFQKLARDVAAAAVVHLPAAACLAAILPQLAQLARHSWLRDPPAGPRLFQLGADLPPLDPHLPTGDAPFGDAVISALAGRATDGGPVSRFAARFRDELRSLRDSCVGAPPTAALAHRYTVVLAAASALAVWDQGDDRYGETELIGVLDRLAGRLDGGTVLTEAERRRTEEHLCAAAADRHADSRLFDLTARRTPAQGGTP
jgi:alkylation response protein AidB-like acyl-CoA dehydrogenase